MIFSTQTIANSKNSELKQDRHYNDSSINFEESYSYFNECLDIILDESARFENEIFSTVALSEGILGGDRFISYVDNKVKSIDFGSIFAKIFDWFITNIAKLVKSFTSSLLSFVNKDAQIKLFKNKLEKFGGSVRVDVPMYNYTNLDLSDSSITSFNNDISNEYDILFSNLDKLQKATTVEQLSSILNDVRVINAETNFNLSLDEIRGKVLGTTRPIASSEYSDALFNFFRDNGVLNNKKVGIFEKNVDAARVREAIREYTNSSKILKSLDRESKQLQDDAKKKKAQIKALTPDKFINNNLTYSKDITALYNNILMTSCRKIEQICSIYIMKISAKIDAIKDYTRLNKLILLEACKEIVKEGY